MDPPWICVSGFGAHIKSTKKSLVIQKKNECEEYPLDSVKNLMVIGGHMINSATISKLIKNGTFITFFEPNGAPVGTIRPYKEEYSNELKKKQESLSQYRFATEIVKGSLKSHLVYISALEESRGCRLFYDGEMELLRASLEEISYLIKMDEIKRMFLMSIDMYYEIVSRDIPSEYGFRRRSVFPHADPINSMLSFGYSMLYGNCCVSLLGSMLDPDLGVLHEGKGSLVRDLIDSFKPSMIDPIVFGYARESLSDTDFEIESGRCLLSDSTITELIRLFRQSINKELLDKQVLNFRNAILYDQEFKVLY